MIMGEVAGTQSLYLFKFLDCLTLPHTSLDLNCIMLKKKIIIRNLKFPMLTSDTSPMYF